MSLYLYALSNPLGAIDPFGLLASPPGGGREVTGSVWNYVSYAAEGFWAGLCSQAREYKDNLDSAARDVIVLGGNTLGLVPDEHLTESDLYNATVNASLDGDNASLAGDLLDVGISGVQQTASDLVSGDPDRMGDAFLDVSIATSPSLAKISRARTAGKVLAGATDEALDTRADARARLSQDLAATGPAPAQRNPVGRTVGRSRAQNEIVSSDVAMLQRLGAQDIRVNQQQVSAAGVRVGINRPDVQYTVNGRRYYIEYDRSGNGRSYQHFDRIMANDPHAGGVLLHIIE